LCDRHTFSLAHRSINNAGAFPENAKKDTAHGRYWGLSIAGQLAAKITLAPPLRSRLYSANPSSINSADNGALSMVYAVWTLRPVPLCRLGNYMKVFSSYLGKLKLLETSYGNRSNDESQLFLLAIALTIGLQVVVVELGKWRILRLQRRHY